jgi:signal transduction histidine kinase
MSSESTSTKRVLVVTGDYDLVRQVRQALSASTFALQTAYSHGDGLYMLENGEFDAVFVDGSMVGRRANEPTLVALAQLKEKIPIIALSPNGELPSNITLPPNVIITQADEVAILAGLSTVLSLPVHDPKPAQNGRKKTAGLETGNIARYADEVQTLFELSKSLTEVLELEEVLNRVVEAARRLTNAEEGMILLPDEEGGQLYLRAKVGIDVEVARNFRVKTQDTLAGNVYSAGQPILIGAQGPQKVKTEYLVNALLYVPILYEGKCIGVLGVNNKNTEAIFHPKHQDLLLNLAAFAAIAIENARIHEETLQRTRELQILVEASQSVNSSLSLDHTLPAICEQLMRVVNVNLSEIYEWHRESNQLRTMARCFRSIWQTGQGPLIELTKRPSMQTALASGRCTAITIEDKTPPLEIEFMNHVGVSAIQMIPISGGSQSLGVVQVYYIRSPQQFPDNDVLQRVQQQALEVFVTLSNQTGPTRMQGIFRVVDEINRLMGADWCELCLFTPNKDVLMVHVAVGKGIWLNGAAPSIDLSRYPDLLDALQSQAFIHKQSDTKLITPGVRALMDAAYSRAILGLPLVQRGEAKGLVLFADSRRNRVFSERDMDMARAIVGPAATALENAGLVHDLEKTVDELRDTQDRLVQTARLSAMGELAAAVAHQINNPLTTIMVDSEMLLMDEKPDSRDYRALQAISRAGKRAAGVARRLLAIARPNDPDAPPERIDVLDTIEGVLSLVKSHIERDRIEIIAQLPPEKLPSVWAVPGQLDDIWLNLLMNAHDALMGRDGAKIGITATYPPDSDMIEVKVWDNGPGIPSAIVNEIFKPFFTTKPVGEGTGLGLHICRQVTERVGGSITVETAPGKGTLFLVRLPVKRGGRE